MFHEQWRDQAIESLRQTFDVVVLGAGITGCGIALDCAQRGLSTLLVERGDIASGTSSRSSKLIHGGLRYLKQMQLRITRLACQERDRLLTLNPHLIKPIRFVYPAYLGDETPAWQIDLGLWMYDQLTGRPDKHIQLELAELERIAPGLITDRLDRALAFNDALADDARLTLAVAATAHAFGAAILPRCEVLGALSEPGGRINGVVVLDHESGSSYRLSARVVVNATGVWTDQLRKRLGLKGRRLRPSRGAHVILPSELVNLQAAVTVLSPDDRRPVFLIPHPEGTLLGTTDLYHEDELDDVRPTEQEVDYLLKAAATAFPGRGIERSQVRGAFAGLRPILDTHADEPSDASREEDIWEESGVISVAGGKLTTWRSTAEDTVDTVLEHLPEERARHAASCHTKGTALIGVATVKLASRLQEAHRLSPEVAEGMARRLGSLAWHGVSLARTPKELEPLIGGCDLTAAEVRAHLRWSAVLHLDDLIIRRTRVGMWQPEIVGQLLPVLRPVVTEEAGWDSHRWDQDLEAFYQALEGWTLAGVRGT